MKTASLTLTIVVVYALSITGVLLWHVGRTKPVYVHINKNQEPGRVDAAVSSALVAMKEKELLRKSVCKVTAARGKNLWVVTFLFEDPPIIGGDVIALVYDDGKVVVGPGL